MLKGPSFIFVSRKGRITQVLYGTTARAFFSLLSGTWDLMIITITVFINSMSTLFIFVYVQRLRSKPWTYMSKFCSGIPLIQDTVASNAGAWLSKATPRLAEQCHTQHFYLRCFKSDFDAIKSKFGLLIE